MVFSLRAVKMALLATCLVSSSAWAANALIVQDGTAGIEADALGNLTSKLTAAGFTVSNVAVAVSGVPAGSLAGMQQVWDIRFNNTTPLSSADIATYVAYMAGGGSLFVMGENAGFATRDNTIVSLVSAAGGGTIATATPANFEILNGIFDGPAPVQTITFLASAGSTTPGTGQFITIDPVSNIGGSIVWGPGSMSAAMAGSLIVVFDVNFLQTGADANSQAFTRNLISYLAAPAPVRSFTSANPIPASFLLALLGCLGILAFELHRRKAARSV
jgi:hypothetical protein